MHFCIFLLVEMIFFVFSIFQGIFKLGVLAYKIRGGLSMKKKKFAKITLGLVILYTISKIISEVEYKIVFDPKMKFKSMPSLETKKKIDEGLAFVSSLKQESITIKNSYGDKIHATFIPAVKESNQYMILSHGYRNYGLREFSFFLPFYVQQNINLLVVDHQAHGKSEGNRITFGLRESKDLLLWMDYLNNRFGSSIQLYLHGISMGATSVLHTIPFLPENVKGILMDCGYANAKKQLIYNMKANHIPLVKPSYRLLSQKLKHRYDVDLQKIDVKKIHSIREVPIKIIHGGKDTFVPTKNAYEIYNALDSLNKELIIFPGATHAHSYLSNPELYQRKIQELLEYK